MNIIVSRYHLAQSVVSYQKILRKVGVGVVLGLWLTGTSMAMWFFNPISKASAMACHTSSSKINHARDSF